MKNLRSFLVDNIEDNKIKTEPELTKESQEMRKFLNVECTDKEFEDLLTELKAMMDVSVEESNLLVDKGYEKWFERFYKDLGKTRWDRYANFLKNNKKFPVNVVNDIQENLFKITDLLGNPNDGKFSRKGLVVGDVQSGKTANYVGLMNLAMDVNYKLIIVLTGTTNKLREQTQARIEEGLGTRKKDRLSVSTYNHTFENPVYLTSVDADFNKQSKDTMQIPIDSTKDAIVIVTKKNVHALNSIYSWLQDYSKKHNREYIESSVLLIDDEADYASVNTRKEEEDPTAINSRIRKILDLFHQNSYIGYTATPFANIFIDPNSNDEMFKQDLFPKDYIYILGEPNNYVGIQSVFTDNGRNKDMLIELSSSEVESYLPLKHKKEYQLTALPPSLKDAINLFLIVNVIRDMRGDEKSHRSMLVNVSYLTNIHSQLKGEIYEYVEELKKIIRVNGRLDYNDAMKIDKFKNLKRVYDVYLKNLSDEYSFKKVLKKMNDSIYRIKTVIANSENDDDLNYSLSENEGERVIVIGGFSLSRGLTLEGLMVSYYYRNSQTYDTLLQMGRWFGYRPGYEDLCKIFMTPDVIGDFTFIATATKELKYDLKVNSKRELTPMEFGIKVRSGQTGLKITARNKMRTGEELLTYVDFSKDVVETTVFEAKEEGINKKNTQLIKEFVKKNISHFSSTLDPQKNSSRLGLKDIDREEILMFLESFITSKKSKFDTTLIKKWLELNRLSILEKWDVAFITGDIRNEMRFDYGYEISGIASKRKSSRLNKDSLLYRLNSSRLGSPSDGRIGMSKIDLKNIKTKHKDKTISQKEYFSKEYTRNPLLLIYSIVPYEEDAIGDEKEVRTKTPIPMITIGIPEVENGNSEAVMYTINRLYKDDIEVMEE